MTVIVTEKPSVARDLAQFLNAGTRKDGYFEGAGYKVTWAFGHLVGLKDPEEYHLEWKRWSLQTLPLIPQSFQLKAIGDPKAQKQLGIIKQLLSAAQKIVCATDAGREGELIFRYIMEFCGLENRPFQRLWLSSLTAEAIRHAFENMRPGTDYNSLYDAARCRSEADWMVGLNGTRNLTIRYGKGVLWSLGRVQTPVLAMIAERDDAICFFQSEPFWELMTTYKEVQFKYTGKRFLQKEKAEAFLSSLNCSTLTIQEAKLKKEKQLPPQLFDLTELQREMNRLYGVSASDTLKGAQHLYESKLITYPRTDSQYITKDMQKDVGAALRKLSSRKERETEALNLQKLSFTKRIVNDSKVTDHHAILPTGVFPGVLSDSQEKLFDCIHTRVLAAFYPPCLRDAAIVEATVSRRDGGKTAAFEAKGTVLVDPGWTRLYPKRTGDTEDHSQTLPAFTVGECGPHQPFLKEGKTQPPKSYTENTLLAAMVSAGRQIDDPEQRELLKDKGIGTPATRAAIIETLLSRQYIERKKKNLKITEKGRYLVALIQNPSLKSAQLTGNWESKLKAIEAGKFSAEEFMKEIKSFTCQILETSDADRVDENQLGPCPLCKSPVIEGKKGFGCSSWKSGCRYVLWKDQDGIQLQASQVRRLLQNGILVPPIGKTLLLLSQTGDLIKIPEKILLDRS